MKKIFWVFYVVILVGVGMFLLIRREANKVLVVTKNDQPEEATKIEEDDFWPQAKKPDIGLEVRLNLKGFAYDLTRRYLSQDDLAKMATKDIEFSERLHPQMEFYKNQSREMRAGYPSVKFTLVSCSGRYSINPMAFGERSVIKECLQLPSGQWIKGLPGFATVFSEGGKIWFLSQRRISELVNEKTLRVAVAGEDGTSLFRSIRWEGYYLGHQYIEVIREGRESYFGGLLENKEGKWIFHSYKKGQNRHWIDRAKVQDDRNIVITFNEWGVGITPMKTEFDPTKGTFTDQ